MIKFDTIHPGVLIRIILRIVKKTVKNTENILMNRIKSGFTEEADFGLLARFGTIAGLIKILLPFSVLLFLTSCSLESSITNLTDAIDALNREEPDFIYGEVVTTSGGTPGYEVKAVFGEVSEKTQSLNGNNWKIEGAFYE